MTPKQPIDKTSGCKHKLKAKPHGMLESSTLLILASLWNVAPSSWGPRDPYGREDEVDLEQMATLNRTSTQPQVLLQRTGTSVPYKDRQRVLK